MKTKLFIFIFAATLLRAAGADAQANQDLSNLTSPTAINQDLIFDSNGTATARIFKTSDQSGDSGSLQITTGTVPNDYNSGVLNLNTADAYGAGNAGAVNIQPGATADGNAGRVYIVGGTGAGNGNAGEVLIVGGAADTGQGGHVTLQGGSVNGTLPGNIILEPGNSSGAGRGVVELKNGHVVASNIAFSPTVTSCGSSPSIVGNDVVGRVSIGAGSFNSCTITFGQAWANAPVCTVVDESAAIALRSATTTTTLTISASSNFASSDVLSFHCVGYQ